MTKHVSDLRLLFITRYLHTHSDGSAYHNMARHIQALYRTNCPEVASLLPLRIEHWKDFFMAKFRSMQFASLSLTENNKKDFQKWHQAGEVATVETLIKLMGDGFKVSCSWIADQNAFCFSIIGTDNTKHHRDMVLTSWSDDLEEVIAIGAYKHYVMCNGADWPAHASGERWG